MTGPDYEGGSLLNLVAELERRLTGEAAHTGLRPDLAESVPAAASYVFVLFDGLGDRQLDHPEAGSFREARVGAIDAPFPTTTTVSLATVATGMSPAEHGLLGYQLWVPEAVQVVNTIKWTTLWGEPIPFEHHSFLPTPNLWERLAGRGLEPITVQPFNFDGTPLSRTLYRGCRFEPYWDEAEAVRATVQLAAEPGRLIFLYVPHVDFAAHVAGQEDDAYAEAMRIAARMWDGVVTGLPAGAVAVGTADHGHIDVPASAQIRIPKDAHEDRILYGDARALFVRGEAASLADDLGVEMLERKAMEDWWGPGERHPSFQGRAPDAVLMAPEGSSILHRHADDRLIGQHGALSDEERMVPLLVG